MPAMGPQPSEEELKVRATESLEALARLTGARGHIWMVIKGDGGKIGGCSPSLRPYGAALMDEVEKATEKPVIVTSKREPSGLLTAEKVLHTLAKTKHVELHPIVATMIQGLNEINNHKHPRIMALTDPSTMPAWFPFPPSVYAPRAQKMDLHQLFHVMDVIFGQVRGNLHAVQTLHSMLDRVYKTGSCSIGTRAGIDSFFEFLEDEAIAKMGRCGGVGVKEEIADDVIPTAASETSGVGGEVDTEPEAASRKRARNADEPNLAAVAFPHASPVRSTANSTQPNGNLAPEDEIDFEKYMLEEEGGQFLAEFDALTQPLPAAPQTFWDPPPLAGVHTPASDLTVAFDPDVQIEESAAAQLWDYRSSGDLTHSGQSTLNTGGSDALVNSDGAFQVASGNGPNSTPTSSRNWAPEWFAPEPEDRFPHADVAPRQQGGPLLGHDEAVVRARLQQQMQLMGANWPAGRASPGFRTPPKAADFPAGGQNGRFRTPPEAADQPNGLSPDYLPQRGAAPPSTYNDNLFRFPGAPNGMQPRIRSVGLAMARAPSFSPSPSLHDRAPPTVPQAPPPAAQQQAAKPGGLFQKARGFMSGAPKAGRGKSEAFPYSRSAPLAPPSVAQGPGSQEFQRSKSDDQPLGPLSGGQQPSERDRRSISGPLHSKSESGGHEERSVSAPQDSVGSDSALLSAGEHSGKALKVLGIDDPGSFSSSGSAALWAGSQDGSGSFDGDAEASPVRKGFARFLPKLGRGKGKTAEKGAGNQPGDPPGSLEAGGGSGEFPLPRQTSGPVPGRVTPKDEALPRHRSGPISGGVVAGERPPPPQRNGPIPGALYPPSESSAPGECEAFPLQRDVQRFESFRSMGSLASEEPESDTCESFPFERPTPVAVPKTEGGGSPQHTMPPKPEGIQDLMQNLSVSEGKPARPAAGANALSAVAPQPEFRSAKQADPLPRLKARAENGVSPRSTLRAGPVVGSPLTRSGGGRSEGDGHDEEDEAPRSPGFALGIGTEDEFDFDGEAGMPQGFVASHVSGPAPEPSPDTKGVPRTVLSVRVVGEAAGVTALSAVPVATPLSAAPGAHLPGTAWGVASAGASGRATSEDGRRAEDEVHDDMLERLQRLRVGA